MEKEICFRQYEPEDDESIVDLLSKNFPKWNSRKDRLNHWRWKYSQPPHGSSIFVALSGAQVLYCNLKIIIPATATTGINETPKFVVKFTSN